MTDASKMVKDFFQKYPPPYETIRLSRPKRDTVLDSSGMVVDCRDAVKMLNAVAKGRKR